MTQDQLTDPKEPEIVTVNPQIRLAGLILFSWLQMRVLLEIEHFCLLFFKFSAGLIRIRVLLEGESYLKIYGMS